MLCLEPARRLLLESSYRKFNPAVVNLYDMIICETVHSFDPILRTLERWMTSNANFANDGEWEALLGQGH